MPSIRLMPSGKYQAIVRKAGLTSYRTFNQKSDARRWATMAELDIERQSSGRVEDASLRELIDRYIREVCPRKKGAARDIQRMLWLREQFGRYTLLTLRSEQIARFRDMRLQQGKSGSTVVKELAAMSHLYEVACKEWGWQHISNPVSFVTKPRAAPHRERRITSEEYALLLSTDLADMVVLAVATGMRLGEQLSLHWSDIDLNARTLVIRDGKTGRRTIPLSPTAIERLHSMKRYGERIFPNWSDACSFDKKFTRTKRRLQREHPELFNDLRWHDMRHSAISALAELGLSTLEIAAVSGHRQISTLQRYVHLRPTDLAMKLAQLTP